MSEHTVTDSPRRPLPTLTAMLVGVLALVAALAAGHLVAGLVGLNASPYLAVGNSAIDLTPTWLKDFAVRTFGVRDKLALLTGMAVVLLGVAAASGVLSRRSARPGTAVSLLLGAVAVVAVATRPDLGTLALLAPLTSVATGVATFRGLHRLAVRDPAGRDQPAARGNVGWLPDRRRFLLTAGGVAVAAGFAAAGGQLLRGGRSAAQSRAALPPLVPVRPAPSVPAGSDFATSGTPTFLTPNPAFYRVDTALVVPQVRTEDWRLRLHGMVDRELRLTYDEVRRRPLVERTITMTCVSNEVGGPYISTANFLGVDLRDLLSEAGVRPGAEQVFSSSVDGFTAGTPLEVLLDPSRGGMLAIGMNGEPLPLEHGFPARMVVPGLYGYVSATKWVVDLEVTTWAARRPYWLRRGWAQRAPIKTQSRIDAPKGFQTVPAGPVTVAGVAWAQTVGVQAVEVRLDDGPWRAAELSNEVNDQTWRMWRAVFDVPAGNHRLACRATDRSGYTQTATRTGTVPDGATGWHTLFFTAR